MSYTPKQPWRRASCVRCRRSVAVLFIEGSLMPHRCSVCPVCESSNVAVAQGTISYPAAFYAYGGVGALLNMQCLDCHWFFSGVVPRCR